MMPKEVAGPADLLRRLRDDELLRARDRTKKAWRRARALLARALRGLDARIAPTVSWTSGASRGRASILIVSHEASRSGAPVLAYNLARTFAGRYDVVVLLLGEGAMVEAFQSLPVDVVLAPVARLNPGAAATIIARIDRRYDLEFALVISLESWSVLAGLTALAVPTVSLIHEFAAYIRPRSKLADVLASPGAVVFSTRITLENALAACPGRAQEGLHVFPQGRCAVPSDGPSLAAHASERARILTQMRPEGDSDDAFVVLGVGLVDIRKGVDLFIACAARVVGQPGGSRCRFVWIGHGYDPERDTHYSVYLDDQIRRAGLERHVVILSETSELAAAIRSADVFVLSSRLDPLPNVAIDALCEGVPVACFDRASGIAEILIEHGLGPPCVAGYMDVADLAAKIVALRDDDRLRRQVADEGRRAALATFDMTTYVERLERVARAIRPARCVDPPPGGTR